MDRVRFLWRNWRLIVWLAELLYGPDGRQRTWAVLLAFGLLGGALMVLFDDAGRASVWLYWGATLVAFLAGFYMLLYLLDVVFDFRLDGRYSKRSRW